MKKLWTIFIVIAIFVAGIWLLDTFSPQIRNAINDTKIGSHQNTIPKGAVYTVYDAETKTYTDIHAGGKFPETINHGDFYTFEGIRYEYLVSMHSWVYISFEPLPDTLLEEINGIPVYAEQKKHNPLDVGLGQASDVTVKDAGEIIYNTVS